LTPLAHSPQTHFTKVFPCRIKTINKKKRHGPRPYPSSVLIVLSTVRSNVPEIYGGQVFLCFDVLMVSVWEMGGFPVVLPPRVTLSAVSGPPPLKLHRHKSGAIKPDTALPYVTSVPRLPMTSPPCSAIVLPRLSPPHPFPACVLPPYHRHVTALSAATSTVRTRDPLVTSC